jgi:hypothetical protein
MKPNIGDHWRKWFFRFEHIAHSMLCRPTLIDKMAVPTSKWRYWYINSIFVLNLWNREEFITYSHSNFENRSFFGREILLAHLVKTLISYLRSLIIVNLLLHILGYNHAKRWARGVAILVRKARCDLAVYSRAESVTRIFFIYIVVLIPLMSTDHL